MTKRYFLNFKDKNFIGDILLKSIIVSTIILWIDYLNLPSKYLPFIEEEFKSIFFIFISIFLIAIIIKLKLIEGLNLNFFTVIDHYLIISLISLLFLFISYCVGFPESIHNRLLLIPLILINIILIFVRIYKVEKGAKKTTQQQANIIDLQDVYLDNIDVDQSTKFYINEESVDYDLLERNKILDHLLDALINSTPQKKFVVSLEGKWGSGKTTIINLLKRKISKNNNHIIDDFDPWIYMDQENMFESMLNYLLKETNIGFSPLHINRIIKQLSKSILGSSNKGWFDIQKDDREHIHEIKELINSHLATSGKKVIFIIDNIDRAEKENILLIFKLVNHVLDFQGVTYLLSFDREQVNNILEIENIPPGYLKKMIQLEVQVPPIDKQILKNIFKKSILNTAKYFNKTEFDILDYIFLIDTLVENNTDLRDFKRLLNSVFIPLLSEEPYLNLRDQLSIEYIKFSNRQLHELIYQNKYFFISHHRNLYFNPFLESFRSKDFNKKGKSFFNELFSNKKNETYLPILEELFPFVKRYNNNNDLMVDYTSPNDQSNNYILRNRGISSGKYFPLYFTTTTNDFADISQIAESITNDFSKNITIKDIHLVINKTVNKDPYTQKELFKQLHLRIDEFPKSNIPNIVTVIFNNIHSINDKSYFLQRGPKMRVKIMLGDLLERLSKDKFKSIIHGWRREFDKIKVIHYIGKSLGNEMHLDNTRKMMSEELSHISDIMVDTILTEEINLYEDKYYYPKNIYGLIWNLQKRNRLEEVKTYISKNINNENVYRLLLDIMSFSIGDINKYKIDKSTLKLYTTEDKIDALLDSTPPQTDSQKFIVKVYNSYKNQSKNNWGQEGVVVDEELDLKV